VRQRGAERLKGLFGNAMLTGSLFAVVCVVLVFAAGVGVIVAKGYLGLGAKGATGAEGLVGLVGAVLEPVGSSGRVSVNGESWSAVTREGVIEVGALVEVVALEPGLVLEVKRKA
jgi:membrane-bound ClpP family serine protease